MYSAAAFNHTYADSGIFMIHASAPPENVRAIVEVIINELVSMAGQPGAQELRRSKTQLQSMLLMNLEVRPVVFEDIGRQVLASGERRQPEYFISEIGKSDRRWHLLVAPRPPLIPLHPLESCLHKNSFFHFAEKVTATDIQRVARRFLATPPSLAARGNIQALPDIKDIQSGLTNNGRLPKSRVSSLFS